MNSIERLIKHIADAKRLAALAREGVARSKAGSDHACRILTDAGRACLRPGDVEHYLIRVEGLLVRFADSFRPSSDVFVLRAPGRINLIGEHTDYNGLPVLPIAINRDIALAAAPRGDPVIRIHNTDARFEPRSFEISSEIEPCPPGDWGNYVKAAAQALQGLFPGRVLRGFDAAVDGNIPMASGLSSSSALVVAMALAILASNELHPDRAELADLLARGEQYVGTRGGGMDQAVSLLAEEGHALRIDFFPTRVERIPFPAGYSFVVCHSMVVAPKASAARTAYNLRAAESRIAAAVLGNALSQTTGRKDVEIERLGDLCSDSIGLSEMEIDSLMDSALEKDTYSLDDAAYVLGMNLKDFRRLYFGAFGDGEIQSLGKLKLRSRARHVISEGRRVRQAAAALKAGRATEFGALMYESHRSCADDYEISIPELDTIVAIAKEAGAPGARLTGAGFGGCAICLVADTDIEAFMDTLEKRYHKEYLSEKKADRIAQLGCMERVFVCRAVDGAGELFR